ncbi:MAG: type II toxin-antitoxin system HicA family toxin [Candidatus Paceibacterota bacterium]
MAEQKIGRIHWKKFEKFLLAVGCEYSGQKGSHRKYHRKGLLRPIVLPTYRNLPVFIILNNLRILGISKEEYIKIKGRL